jgi:hypothetical protein
MLQIRELKPSESPDLRSPSKVLRMTPHLGGAICHVECSWVGVLTLKEGWKEPLGGRGSRELGRQATGL